MNIIINSQLAKIQKELKAPKGQLNKFGNYNYRSCEDIVEAVKPLLNGLTLTISDEMVYLGSPLLGQKSAPTKENPNGFDEVDLGGRFYVKATATLSDGESTISTVGYARESFDKKGMDSSQITGSASSYARKYALNGLFAIDDTKDADTQDNSVKATKPAFTKPLSQSKVYQAQNKKDFEDGKSPF